MLTYTYRFLPEDNTFSPDNFRNPPISCAPIYSWLWNGPVSHEETDRQLAEMQRLGIRYFYIIPEPKLFRPHFMLTLMEPDYLTPAYFEEYHYAMERAEALGMKAWIYDEGGWPSGGACGKVLTKHPEYARRMLTSRTVKLPAGTPYRLPENALAAFFDGDVMIKSGTVFDTEREITEYFCRTSLFEGGNTSDFPDITIREAAEAFLEMTHEGYKPYLAKQFGGQIPAVFTDEPTAPRAIYREEISAEFERRAGYSIMPYLPAICQKVEAKGKAVEALGIWYDLCSELFCRNFMLTQKKWCNDHNMAFTGHMDIDNTPLGSVHGGNFHMLRALRCFDIPGIDVILRQIFPCEANKIGNTVSGENYFFPRFASSAASQIGGRYALTESFGVYGIGLTPAEMRWTLTFQAIRGINIFNLMLIPYARDGWLMTGELPYFTENHACYADLAPFNRYLERLSYVSSLGDRVAETALYFPIADFWAGGRIADAAAESFNATGFAMEYTRIPFDVIDDDILREVPADGQIVIGKARYSTIVVPDCAHMPEDVRAKLRNFAKSGGRVIRADEVATLVPPLTFDGDARGIRVQERQLENGRLFLISNENLTAVDVQLDAPGYQLLELTEGEILHFEGTLHLESGELAALLQSEMVPAVSASRYTSEQELSGFTLRRARRNRIGEMTYINEDITEEAQPVELGDWRKIVGDDFSGSCIYATEFCRPDAEKICIDLGDVRHTAELFINGKSHGVRVTPPYRWEIADDLGESNKLEVRVTNTSANEYMTTKSFDKWQNWQIGPYAPRARDFHWEALPSGLIGPVKLQW